MQRLRNDLQKITQRHVERLPPRWMTKRSRPGTGSTHWRTGRLRIQRSCRTATHGVWRRTASLRGMRWRAAKAGRICSQSEFVRICWHEQDFAHALATLEVIMGLPTLLKPEALGLSQDKPPLPDQRKQGIRAL